MTKKYFRKKNPNCRTEDIEWIEMTGREYYRFVSDPANKNRHFIDMDDVVLESTKSQQRDYKADTDHSDYLAEQQEGWTTVSLYGFGVDGDKNGEDAVGDETANVEQEAFKNLRRAQVRAALRNLPAGDWSLINALYLAEPRKTLRQLSAETGIPVMTLEDRKQKILATLRAECGEKNFSEKNKKIFRTKRKKVRNKG